MLPGKCAFLSFLAPLESVSILPGPVGHPVAGPREENGLGGFISTFSKYLLMCSITRAVLF